MRPGSTKDSQSCLSIEALPASAVPILRIEWPSRIDGESLHTTHELKERCCYWEFYTTDFAMPQEAGVGDAKISFELPEGAMPSGLTTSEILVPVERMEGKLTAAP